MSFNELQVIVLLKKEIESKNTLFQKGMNNSLSKFH